jgi:hypothetical protein
MLGIQQLSGEQSMERNWDVIREVLIEVESLTDEQRQNFVYAASPDADSMARNKAKHALLLFDAGFISGHVADYLDDGRHLMMPDLTWEGHELLATLRSKPIWERIKNTAQERGIELSFDAVVQLGKAALALLIG